MSKPTLAPALALGIRFAHRISRGDEIFSCVATLKITVSERKLENAAQTLREMLGTLTRQTLRRVLEDQLGAKGRELFPIVDGIRSDSLQIKLADKSPPAVKIFDVEARGELPLRFNVLAPSAIQLRKAVNAEQAVLPCRRCGQQIFAVRDDHGLLDLTTHEDSRGNPCT